MDATHGAARVIDQQRHASFTKTTQKPSPATMASLLQLGDGVLMIKRVVPVRSPAMLVDVDNVHCDIRDRAQSAITSPVESELPTATLSTVDLSLTGIWEAKRMSRRISHHGHVNDPLMPLTEEQLMVMRAAHTTNAQGVPVLPSVTELPIKTPQRRAL